MRLTFFSLVFLLALTGCRSVWDPTFMPAGYSYHHGAYKAPPGPESKEIGYTYTAQDNAAVMNRWREAVRDMLMKMKAEGIEVPPLVVLKTDLRQNAFEGAYDSVLREGLHAFGHSIGLTQAKDQPVLFYSAYDPAEQGNIHHDPAVLYNDDMASPYEGRKFVPANKGMELVIGLVKDGHWVKKVSGVYDLPLYGYQPGAYISGEDNPLREYAPRASIPQQPSVNP